MRTRWLLCILLALAALSAGALLLAPKGGVTAEIYLDGQLYRTIDLSQVEAGETIAIGDGNIAQVEPGRIRMLEADCPDRLCVRRGWTASAAKPLVCLPNRVLVVVSGSGGGEVDAVSG